MAKKAKYPNIVRGGIAIPIPNRANYYYMKGRKHKDGGIDIGENPRTGLEVEDGEVLHLTDNNIKVYSSVPFLNGKSPAEKVLGGDNPNKVFKQQEDFKDKNNLNDDGTRKAEYGKKAAVVRTPEDENVSKLTRSYYKEVNPLAGYPSAGDAIAHGMNVFGRRYKDTDSTAYPVTDRVADATWRKRLGLSYDEADLPSNADGSVRLPKDRELEMPVDTNLLKRRINANLKLSDKYKQNNKLKSKEVVDWAIGEDQAALDALRHTYKTGEPVVVNEQVYNTRSLINNGKISMPGSSPLNPLQNYTLQYDKDRHVMMYRDVYDFNHLDWAVPGKGYKIKGEIDLNKKQMGGITNKPVTITVNGKTKVVYSPSTGGTRSEAKGVRNKALLGKEKKEEKEISEEERQLIENYHTRKHADDNWDIPVLNYNTKAPISFKKKVTTIKPADTSKINKVSNYNIVDVEEDITYPINDKNNDKNNDRISLAGNIVGSLLSSHINKRALDKMRISSAPTPRQAIKLKTRINITPQLDRMRETLTAYERNINANTASSRVALARKNRASMEMLSQYNTLLGDKENKETTLINQDRLNRQNISNQNIADYNAYLDKKATFENAIIDKESENRVGLINNLNSAIQSTIANKEKRRKDKNSLIAAMAANPNVNPKYFRDLGADWITDEMIANWEKANKKG